ncbi:MAG: hypothetical protein AAFQ15_07450 [Pseudomonadota bacterium]
MSNLNDLTIPLSALDFTTDSTASATADDWTVIQVGVLLQAVVERHAKSLVEEGELHSVSVTFDVSADAATGSEVTFESRIDRKTRTLVFASGIAKQNDRHLLKATVVFRIS